MAEHSYEQVMTALRNADAAGDTEAATRLASIAQGYKQEPKPTSSFSLERGIQDVPRILKDTATGMIGAGEAGLNLGLQLPSMAYAALDKLQEGVDIGLDKLGISPYPEQKGRGEERYVKAMEASNYTPRTELGKENLEVVGKAFNDVGMPLLASGLPVGAALGSGLQAIGKGMTKFNAGKVPRTNPFMEKVLAEDATKAQPTQMPRIQTELDLGQPNQFGHRPSEFTIDENGIPIRRNASLEAQETVRQGDLFSLENQAQELRNDVLNRAEPAQEGFPANREYLRKQEEELAYQQKAKQDSLPIEEPVAEPSQRSLGQTGFGKGQRGSIGFFGKDPFEKFSEETKQSYPDATPEQIKRAWDLQQAEHLKPQQNRAKQEAITKMVGGNINDKLTVYDGSKPEEIVAAIQTSPELTKEPGTYQKWFAPKGQIAKELVDNPGVNAGISRIKHITGTFARKSETELFGPEGIITRITKFENPLGPGKMSNLFKERFKAKNDPAYKQALNNAEREIDTALDTLFTKNLDEVNKILVAEGKEPVQGVHKYFPSIFDGKFVFEVRKNGGKPVLMTSHNRNQYNLMRDLMQAEGLEVGPVKERAALQNRFGDTDHLVAEYQMMLDFMDSKAPEVVAVRNAMEGIEQASATTTAGYHNRFKESRGYQGNLGNNPYLSDVTNFYDAKRALTRYQEAHNAWLAAKELTSFDKQLGQLKDAPSSVIQYVSGQIQDIVVKRGVDSITAPMTDLVKSITGISESKQLSAIRQYANLNTVRMVGAGSMRALTQNFFQPIEAILPKFLQMYPHLGGGKFDIVSPALHGLFDYFQVLGKHNLAEIKDLGSSVFNLNNTKLENDLFGVTSSELYKTAVDTGLIDPTVLESTPLFDRKLAQGSWKFGSGLISRSSEQAARFATFSTFTRWLIDAGVPKEQAILQAKQWTEGHMVDYSIEAKPGFMTKTGVVGEAAGRLQTFKATQLGRYVVYIQEAMKSGNTKPLAAMLTINLMLAGLQGMIGMDVLSTVLDGVSSVSKDPKDKEFSFRRWVSEKAPEWANWGVLSTTTGLGLFNAFSQQSIGDGSLANMFPVYAGAAEQGRAVFRRASTDWETENVGEKARQLSAFVPSSLQPRIDRELLTQNVLGKKTAISKFTNQPVYTYQEGDYSVGNISPFEKSKQSSLRNEMRKEGERFTTGKKDLEKELESKAMDIYAYGKKNAFNQKAFDNMIMDFVVGYKGNPEILDKVFKNLAIKSGMTKHELVRLLQMNKVDYEQLPEVNRMLKYSELMEKRK